MNEIYDKIYSTLVLLLAVLARRALCVHLSFILVIKYLNTKF